MAASWMPSIRLGRCGAETMQVLHGAQPRAKNTATAEEVAAVLRGSMPQGLEQAKYLQVDLDQVVEDYQEVMVLLLRITQRPVATVIQAAASLAFQAAPQEAAAFAQRLCAAFAHCQSKRKSCTSGKKLPPAVFRVVQCMGFGSCSPFQKGDRALGSASSGASSSQVGVGCPLVQPVQRGSSTVCVVDLTKRPIASQSRSRTPHSREEILHMYGQAEPSRQKTAVLPVLDNELVVLSSQGGLSSKGFLWERLL